MPGTPRYRIELACLKLALQDEKRFSMLSPDMFSEQDLRNFLIEVSKIRYEENNFPSISLLEEKFRQKEIWEKYSKVFDALFNIHVKENEWDELFKALIELRSISIIEQSILKASEELEHKKYNSAIATLKEGLENFQSFDKRVRAASIEVGGADAHVDDLTEDKLLSGTEFISTGYDLLDNRIGGGFRKGDLVVISAVKGTGKSAFAMNLLYNAYKFGMNVVYGNFEMSKEVWFQRYLSLISGVSFRAIYSGDLSFDQKFLIKSRFILDHFKDDFAEELLERLKKKKDLVLKLDMFALLRKLLRKYRQHAKENKIILYQKSNVPYWELDADVQRFKEQSNIDLLVIDYINFIKHENPKLPSWDQLKTISDRLKQMAIKYNIVVIVLSQLNAKEQDTKYSAGITEAADLAFAWTLSSSYFLPDAKVYDFRTLKTRNIRPIDDLFLIGQFDCMRVRFEINEQAAALGDENA